MAHEDTTEKLNLAIQRLMAENAQTRQKIEEAEVILRRRAPNADGLSLAAAVKTILDDRDAARARTQDFREELRKALKLLLADDADGAKRALNLFLFNNPK